MSMIKIDGVQLWRNMPHELALLRGFKHGDDYVMPVFAYAIRNPFGRGAWYDDITKARVIAQQRKV